MYFFPNTKMEFLPKGKQFVSIAVLRNICLFRKCKSDIGIFK